MNFRQILVDPRGDFLRRVETQGLVEIGLGRLERTHPVIKHTELQIDGKWVKCTPAFDKVLCERARIKPLDFDGVNDSLFHPFDQAGRRHMEYLQDRGAYADVPFDTILADFKTFYPKLVAASPTAASFRDEVTT